MTRTPLLSRNVHRSALAITKSKGDAGIEPSVKSKELPQPWQGTRDIILPDILGRETKRISSHNLVNILICDVKGGGLGWAMFLQHHLN